MAFPYQQCASNETEPKIFGCCCRVKNAGTAVFVIECALCILALIGTLMQVSQGNISSLLSGLTAIITLICAVFLYRGVRTEAPQKLVPYLIWKPIESVLEVVTLIYFAVKAPQAYDQALAESLDEEQVVLDELDQKYLDKIFEGVYAAMLSILAVYLVVGLVFIYVVIRCRAYLVQKAARLPVSAQQTYNVPVFAMPQAQNLVPRDDAPPPYSSDVYAPTVEKMKESLLEKV